MKLDFNEFVAFFIDGKMAYNFYEMRQRNNEIANDVRYEPNATTADIDSETQCDWNSPSSYFELNNSTVSGIAFLFIHFNFSLSKCLVEMSVNSIA